MRLRRIGPVLLAALAVLSAAACSPTKTFKPNVAPETSLFVQGPIDTLTGTRAPVDTVNHVVHLYWFGSDPDGFVVRFEYRFVFEGEDADTVKWNGILETDHVFTVATPTGFAMPRFEVRAVDDDSLRDETPAIQDFQFSNAPPNVQIIGSPPVPDTTFASVTVRWAATDPDGDAGKVQIRAWLDGREAQAHVLAPGTSEFTFPTDDFRNGSGDLVSGPRTVFVQAIDDGGRAGTPASASWYVRAPEGATVLVVDNVPATAPSAVQVDDFYRTTIGNHIPGQYQVLDLERQSPFRSMKDFEQTLKLFPVVLWFRETNQTFSTLLHDYQPALEAYLRDGRNSFFITGLGLFEGENVCGPSTATNCGYLTEGLATEFLDTNFFYKAPIPTRVDSTVAWTSLGSRRVYLPLYADSLTTRSYGGLRGFAVGSPSSALVVAPPNTLNQPHDYELPIAVRVVQPTGGKAIFFSFPLTAFSLQSGRNPRIIQKLLDDMMLDVLP